MPEATITSKSGAVISIHGTEKEVANILSLLENSSPVSPAKQLVLKGRNARKKEAKRAGASDIIVILQYDGFFNKPKSLSQIEAALEEKGYLYPVTTLSGVMLGLVKRKIFGRKKVGGRWVYGK